jgi:hypothetical protein
MSAPHVLPLMLRSLFPALSSLIYITRSAFLSFPSSVFIHFCEPPPRFVAGHLTSVCRIPSYMSRFDIGWGTSCYPLSYSFLVLIIIISFISIPIYLFIFPSSPRVLEKKLLALPYTSSFAINVLNAFVVKGTLLLRIRSFSGSDLSHNTS